MNEIDLCHAAALAYAASSRADDACSRASAAYSRAYAALSRADDVYFRASAAYTRAKAACPDRPAPEGKEEGK